MWFLVFENNYGQEIYWTGKDFSFIKSKAKYYKRHSDAERALDRIRKTRKTKSIKLNEPAIAYDI